MTTTYSSFMQRVKRADEDDVETLCALQVEIWQARATLSRSERIMLEALIEQKLCSERVA